MDSGWPSAISNPLYCALFETNSFAGPETAGFKATAVWYEDMKRLAGVIAGVPTTAGGFHGVRIPLRCFYLV